MRSADAKREKVKKEFLNIFFKDTSYQLNNIIIKKDTRR